MSPMSYDAAVAAWADHLRSGGTTTWSAWLETDHPRSAPTTTTPLPDAVHLELVRRLNERSGRADEGLADLVLATASPGRGLVDVPLPWPAAPRGYGSPAIDPARLPREELIRLAVGVLVRLVPGLPSPEAAPPPAPWPLPWRRRFRLHGSPGTAAAVRGELVRQGLVESDWRPVHVVLARPVEVMMAERWAARARLGGSPKWATLWRRQVAAGRLPHAIDVAAIARRLEGRAREPVHVVVARDAEQVARATARVLGARSFTVTGDGDPAHTDLLRRVNRLTAVTAGTDRVRGLASRLAAALDGIDAPGTPPPPPFVPDFALGWARDQAAGTAAELDAAGYAVHGDPGDLSPSDQPHPGTIDRDRTLELALAACLRTWRLQGGTP
jgi:hypothetical protein